MASEAEQCSKSTIQSQAELWIPLKIKLHLTGIALWKQLVKQHSTFFHGVYWSISKCG